MSKNKLDFGNEQIIRYMGNKRAILDKLIPVINRVHDEKKYFCDLMAGTNSVSYAIKTLQQKNIGIISNDAQRFSHIIAKALIKNNSISKIPIENAKKDLMDHFDENLKEINKKWDDKFILKNQYRTNRKGKNQREKYSDDFPFCLFTFYYANVFFSLEQCKEIDSLRYAIEQVKNPTKKNMYLTSLLYAASYGGSTFGHFAQPRKVTKEVKELRTISILDLFLERLESLKVRFNDKKNYCFNLEHNKLFKNKNFKKIKNKIGTIYLDPPYSPANYSRFYHVLETLIKYDYPENEYKGLYRDNRFKSSFCKVSEVENAFREVISFAHENECNLVISYSNVGLLSKKEIKKLCKEKYTKKRAVRSEKDIHHLHSTQGNRKKNGVKEIIIVCRVPARV